MYRISYMTDVDTQNKVEHVVAGKEICWKKKIL